MSFYIPTREECFQHDKTHNELFYRIETIVEGYQVELYGYRFAKDTDFAKYNTYELRGLTFIFDEQTQKWKHFIALNKFFNINQCEKWNYQDVKGKNIVRVQDKADGSLISFVKFPNDVIRAKSKMSFESEQAQMAQDIFEKNSKLKHFVKVLLSTNLIPIFELVSPFNQIVLQYKTTELLLLHVRNNDTGEYLDKEAIANLSKRYDIKIVDELEINTLDYYMTQKNSVIGIEGWILTFEDGQMLKIKTEDYFAKHGLVTDVRENYIIQLVLSEEIDDIISIMTGEKKEFVQSIRNKTIEKINLLTKEYLDLRFKYFNVYNENRKNFALEYKNERMFSYVMKTINTTFKEIPEVSKNVVKEYVTFHTNSLSKAQEFLKD